MLTEHLRHCKADYSGFNPPPLPKLRNLYSVPIDLKPNVQLEEDIKRLATIIVDREGAFGMKFGGITWKANDNGGWLAWADPHSPSLEQLTDSLEKMVDYIQNAFQIKLEGYPLE